MYGTVVWQHNTLAHCAAALADNAIKKILSNFHCVMVIEEGIKRHGMDKKDKRIKDLEPVDCMEQMNAYCELLHQNNNGNSVKSRYML